MTKAYPFEEYSDEYDEWFDANRHIYLSELEALKALVPMEQHGIEIGIGTGRFALPLG